MASWKIDTHHSAANFTVTYMMFANVNGFFADIDGILEYDPNHPADSTISVRIKADSLHSGSKDRDAHLRSADFFNVEAYPYINFESTHLALDAGEKSGVLRGDLSMAGVTQSVDIQIRMIGDGYDPAGQRRIGFKGYTTVDREAFGLKWNQKLESGGTLVGREVKIELIVQAMPLHETVEAPGIISTTV